jgi:hypothetical protein
MVCRFINNFLSYKSAPQLPSVVWNGSYYYYRYPSNLVNDWIWCFTKPYYIGLGTIGNMQRNIRLAPAGYAASGGDVRVTLSLHPPYGGTENFGPSASYYSGVDFYPPYHQATFEASTIGTTFAIPASQDVQMLGWQNLGWGYMTVELKADDWTVQYCQYHGMCEQQVRELIVRATSAIG